MITAQNENHTVTRNSSFFKTLDQSVVNHDDDQSRDSGLSSPADIKHQQELPAARTHAHASDPSASKPVSSPGMQANPTSSFGPIPESEAIVSHPVGQPPLRRSSRKRVDLRGNVTVVLLQVNVCADKNCEKIEFLCLSVQYKKYMVTPYFHFT